jgi:hypothetical protein
MNDDKNDLPPEILDPGFLAYITREVDGWPPQLQKELADAAKGSRLTPVELAAAWASGEGLARGITRQQMAAAARHLLHTPTSN